MMNDAPQPDLPPLGDVSDASDMESLLGHHRPAGPSPALRGRITAHGRQQSRWAFIEAMAALFLIGANLAPISAALTEFVPSLTWEATPAPRPGQATMTPFTIPWESIDLDHWPAPDAASGSTRPTDTGDLP